MGFGDAIQTCFKKYADFSGRASRPEYWWFVLSYVIVYVGGAVIATRIRAFWTIVVIVGLAYLIPLLAAAVRRLHDTGRSGWWYFIAFVPLVGPIILIVFLATAGDAASNMYGPPPGYPAGGSGALPPPPPPA